jgi:RNA polymerase sigma factor (sigma-70 family)
VTNHGSATPESFEQFVEEHYQSAYRFALSLCCHEADACDLTQQVFSIAQSKFHQIREASKQKSWLFTILAREFARGRRKRAQYEHHSLELVEAELPLITVDHATQIDARGLLATLLGLDEHFRVPLTLFYFEQLSYKEIAGVMEVPIGTVMSRLARGKELLRQGLERTGRNRNGPPAGEASNEKHG